MKYFSKSFGFLSLIIAVLFIFSGGSVTVTGEIQDLAIEPVNYNADDQVVTILNRSASEINVTGFVIKDNQGNRFQFSRESEEPIKLKPFGIVRVHSGPGAERSYESPEDFFWTEDRVWAESKTVQLVDSGGKVVDELDLSELDQVDQLAGCLTRQGAVLYGLATCPHCQDQKDKFDSSVKFINYVECLDNRDKCVQEGIRSVPAWIFDGGKKTVGTKSLHRLAEIAGCSYSD